LKQSATILGAQDFYEFLPMIFAGRVVGGSQTPLGSGISKRDRQILRSKFSQYSLSDYIDIFEMVIIIFLFSFFLF